MVFAECLNVIVMGGTTSNARQGAETRKIYMTGHPKAGMLRKLRTMPQITGWECVDGLAVNMSLLAYIIFVEL